VDVEEEKGKAAGKVSQESFRHGTKVSLDILGQILIMMFLGVNYIRGMRMTKTRSIVPCCEEHGANPEQTCHHIFGTFQGFQLTLCLVASASLCQQHRWRFAPKRSS
jgi:hypothetical protein